MLGIFKIMLSYFHIVGEWVVVVIHSKSGCDFMKFILDFILRLHPSLPRPVCESNFGTQNTQHSKWQAYPLEDKQVFLIFLSKLNCGSLDRNRLWLTAWGVPILTFFPAVHIDVLNFLGTQSFYFIVIKEFADTHCKVVTGKHH